MTSKLSLNLTACACCCQRRGARNQVWNSSSSLWTERDRIAIAPFFSVLLSHLLHSLIHSFIHQPLRCVLVCTYQHCQTLNTCRQLEQTPFCKWNGFMHALAAQVGLPAWWLANRLPRPSVFSETQGKSIHFGTVHRVFLMGRVGHTFTLLEQQGIWPFENAWQLMLSPNLTAAAAAGIIWLNVPNVFWPDVHHHHGQSDGQRVAAPINEHS